MLAKLFLFAFVTCTSVAAQTPPIEPGVSHDLAKWRAAHYSDVRYKLNLTLEKMSPVLKGAIEIRVRVDDFISRGYPSSNAYVVEGNVPTTTAKSGTPAGVSPRVIPPIVLDWRKIAGHEKDSTISNVSINGIRLKGHDGELYIADSQGAPYYNVENEHLIFRDEIRPGENVIKLDFTSPILTSGSAITRYVDKEDGAEYIYSLFVPSDASTAFPVFDQPDLKAKFQLSVGVPANWKVVSNSAEEDVHALRRGPDGKLAREGFSFAEAGPISTYLFAFAAGEFAEILGERSPADSAARIDIQHDSLANRAVALSRRGASATNIYVRKSQAGKFKPHAAEVARLRDAAVSYLESYFDYKFPFPKYDVVLIPEFPFGGMEHAGATFLRESSVIFPTEPTANDYISRANVIFHETAHQWFGDTVTMKWFDDLWLKEGFAEFMAYKTLEKVMPQYNAWKVFYERNKQAAYLTDSTKGTTAIYQPIDNLSSAKSAYGNIVYRKAPSFLRQAEFYLGEDKFQTAVRAFLKKHEYANAGWEDLVKEFEAASGQDLKEWGNTWVTTPGLPKLALKFGGYDEDGRTSEGRLYGASLVTYSFDQVQVVRNRYWQERFKVRITFERGESKVFDTDVGGKDSKYFFKRFESSVKTDPYEEKPVFILPNYQDYGYGIFLLDDKSRDYVLKNIQNENDDFLRTMMWGSLWDSVREAELDPKEYVELVVKNIATEKDESTISILLGRISTAMNYYLSDGQRAEISPRLEAVLLDKMQHAPTAGQRITFQRAFVSTASTEKGREVLKEMLRQTVSPAVAGGTDRIVLRAKDKFDIVTRLAILGDADAPALLANLEKTETSDDAKRYAYAAHAAFATAENKAKFWDDFLTNKDISESWIEAAIGPFNSIRHAALTQQYLEHALAQLPNLKRSRKIFFVNGWLGAFIGGQRDAAALAIVNKFLADNPNLDNDLRLKILENVDLIERAVKIRAKYGRN